MDIEEMVTNLSMSELNEWLEVLKKEKETRDAQREARLWENVVKAIKAYCDEFSCIFVEHDYYYNLVINSEDNFATVGEIHIKYHE